MAKVITLQQQYEVTFPDNPNEFRCQGLEDALDALDYKEVGIKLRVSEVSGGANVTYTFSIIHDTDNILRVPEMPDLVTFSGIAGNASVPLVQWQYKTGHARWLRWKVNASGTGTGCKVTFSIDLVLRG